MNDSYYRNTFRRAVSDASLDYDERGLAFVQRIAMQMRREPDGATPYADGYCTRVGELTRMKENP